MSDALSNPAQGAGGGQNQSKNKEEHHYAKQDSDDHIPGPGFFADLRTSRVFYRLAGGLAR